MNAHRRERAKLYHPSLPESSEPSPAIDDHRTNVNSKPTHLSVSVEAHQRARDGDVAATHVVQGDGLDLELGLMPRGSSSDLDLELRLGYP